MTPPDHFARSYSDALRYGSSGWSDFSERFKREPHHLWGGQDADHSLRAVAADAYAERGDLTGEEAEHGAALLRNPNEHVVVDGDGKVKRGRFNVVGVDQGVIGLSRYLDHHIPFGYPSHWNVMPLEHRPNWYTMEDANGNDHYHLSHHARYLPEQVANFLDRDVDTYENNEHLEPDQVAEARRLIHQIRTAPTEEVHPNQDI